MRKDDRLSFRVSAQLKRQIESVADQEGRSLAQVSEALLQAGLELYRKAGTKIIQRSLSRNPNK